jgi:hypothetical protein
MLNFHTVDIERELDRQHPLYVGNFFSLKGMWWTKRKQRQALILSIAIAWHRLLRNNPSGAGFVEEETLITNLTRQVKDARVILDRFFKVTKVGFNFNNGIKSPSTITPKRLGKKMLAAVEDLLHEVHFSPGPEPTGKNLVKSSVRLEKNIKSAVMTRLKYDEREDLIPPVAWILKQDSPITFYFRPSGKLQSRDTSVWPIRAIETWPGWLREMLFGTVIDIENSYSQFLVQNLERKYKSNPLRMELKYPDVLRSDRDKVNFRQELLDLLKLDNTYENMKVVKSLIMSLANGSNASPALMTNGSGRSEAVRIVLVECPHLLPTELTKVGKRLSTIVKQFQGARRDLCIYMLKARPTRANQKKIFSIYLDWERKARYKIWNATGRTGLMLHDGIDGVVSDKTGAELVQHIAQQTSIRVSVDKPMMEAA